MSDIAAITGNQVLVMFILIAVGFVVFRQKMLNEQGVIQISNLLMRVITPTVMVVTFDRDFDASLMLNLAQMFLLCVVATAFAVGLAFAFVRGKSDSSKLERFSMCFSNCGFMGIPLIEAVLGADAVIYASVAIMVFNLSQWTFGRLMLKSTGSLRESVLRIVTSPGIIGVALGIALFVSPLRLPSPIQASMNFVSRTNTPLAMFVVGAYIARADLLHYIKSVRVWRVSAVRLVIVGLLMLPLYRLLGFPSEVNMANFLVTCCPVAAVAAMFPPVLGIETGDEGSGHIAVSTLLSIGTMPLMVLIYGLTINR